MFKPSCSVAAPSCSPLCGSSTHRQFMSVLHCVARLIAEEVAPPAESPRPGQGRSSGFSPDQLGMLGAGLCTSHCSARPASEMSEHDLRVPASNCPNAYIISYHILIIYCRLL